MQIPFLRKPFDHINPNSREHLTFRTARWLVTFGLAAAASFTWVQGATVYQFQQGLNGYDGALDTQIRGGSPDREDGAVASLSIDGSDGGGANHILMRFEKLSGTGPGQIPAGSKVIAATLTMRFTDPGDDPDLHRVLVPWDNSTTWNTFDPIWLDGVTADGFDAAIDPDVMAIEAGSATPFVALIELPTQTIQDWLDGKVPNYGWAFIPSGGGGADFDTSEATTQANRPLLTIVTGTTAEADSVLITEHPQNVSLDEGLTANFSVNHLNNLGPADTYTYQWLRNGASIVGATSKQLVINPVTIADNSAKISVQVSAAGKSATSTEAVVTVTLDTEAPVLLSAKGKANRTELTLSFSERISQASAENRANYAITSASGSLNITAASLSGDGTRVTLATASQTLNTKYTITVNNITDLALKPNAITAGAKMAFLPVGKIVENANGFIVFEAENYDRNLDGLWIADTERGNPSGGSSMVVPNGTGSGENSSKLEYDVEFKQSAIYIIWYLASGNDGSDDSAWFHIDGERPFERANANDAAMTGFSGALDFVWRTDSFGGADPMSVDIFPAGLHVVGLAQRENGSFFDKFILTTDETFAPTGFGPPETREGAPSAPTVSLSSPTAGQTFAKGASVTVSANAAADARLDILRVEFLANGNKIGEATTSPYTVTWNNVTDGVFAVTARVTDELLTTATSAPITIGVGDVGLPYQQADTGLAVMEAENYHALTPAPDGHTWEFSIARADFSGGGHMQAIPDDGINQSVYPDLLTESPRLDYKVNFVKSGTHYIWVRGGDPAAAGAGDSVNGGIDGDNPPTALRIDGAPGFNIGAGWNWVGNIQGDTRATIEVASIGDHIVNIWMREDGFYFDKVIVTSDQNFAPTGTGPAESNRVGGNQPPQSGSAKFSAPAIQGNNIVLTWTGGGTLQSADAVTGPWADVANAGSPASVPKVGAQKFYRVRQ